MAGLIRKLWRVAAGIFAGVVILAAVLVGLLRLALVQVPEYREQIQAQLGEALGWPVEIGVMDARLGLRGPELNFRDAQVMSHDGERVLVRAVGGGVDFDFRALLRGQLLPGTVSLTGLSLRIERDSEGRWRLVGEEGPFFTEDAASADSAVLPALAELPQLRLELSDARLAYQDHRYGVGPWTFRLEELGLELDDGTLSVSAQGRLPAALGTDFSLSAEIQSQDARGRPRAWSAGADFSALELGVLGTALGRSAALPAAGVLGGSLSASADDGRPKRFGGELQVQDLSLPDSIRLDGAAGQAYERVAANFDWLRTAAGWQVDLSALQVERGGRRWQSDQVQLVLRQEAAARNVEASADLLQLEDLLPAAGWLPEAARSVIAELAPEGALRELEASLRLPADEDGVPDGRIAAHFDGLSLRARQPTPGLRNLSGRLSGDSRSGSIELDSRELEFAMPWLFREPLAAAAASGTMEWARDGDGLALKFPSLELSNNDATVSARGELQIPTGDVSPRLELEAMARDVSLSAAPRYLPVGKMPDKVVRWLDQALLGGRVGEAQVVFRGATRQFPFREDEGLFRAEFDVAEGELAFDPGWPGATGLDVSVRFENEGLWAEIRDGRLLEVEAGPASLSIPDLRAGQLSIEGEARGEMTELRDFVLASTLLEGLLGPGLEPAEIGAGRAVANVSLSLPLRELKRTRAQVELQVSDAVLGYSFLGEPLRDINGVISIDNARVSSDDISATLAGSPLRAGITVLEDGAIRIEGGGPIEAGGLARLLRVPLLDTWVEGETRWRGELLFPAPGSPSGIAMEFSSRLEGFAIGLPAPIGKAADDSRSLRVRASFLAAGMTDWEAEWDESLRVRARLDHSGAESRFMPVPGGIPGNIGAEPAGMVFSGTVGQLDLGAWLDLDLPAGMDGRSMPDTIAGGRVLIGRLAAPMISFDDLLLELARVESGWRLEVSAVEVAGSVSVPHELYGIEPVTARLERLWLNFAADAEPGSQTPADGQPARDQPAYLDPALVPSLDVEIGDLRYGEIRFGSVSARLLHEGDGFELIGLESIGDGFIFQAEGSSRLSGAVDASRLGLSIRSEDLGATLEFMGFRRSIEAEKATFEADVEWQGGLPANWLAAIDGNANISIRDGTLIGVEPGAGRVFGLLSLQALPRRLALDFKDVFGQGTAFDSITGDFRFNQGDAFTENLLMQGPSAEMVLVGRTGMVARDYDQRAVIAADLGRTLPVAGTVVAGPAVGAALFLLSEVLRKPFQAQITYRITGPWENPEIERLGARSLAPPPQTSPAPDQAPPPDEASPPQEEGE